MTVRLKQYGHLLSHLFRGRRVSVRDTFQPLCYLVIETNSHETFTLVLVSFYLLASLTKSLNRYIALKVSAYLGPIRDKVKLQR